MKSQLGQGALITKPAHLTGFKKPTLQLNNRHPDLESWSIGLLFCAEINTPLKQSPYDFVPDETALFLGEIAREFQLDEITEICQLGGTAAPKWSVLSNRGKFVVRMRPEESVDEAGIMHGQSALRQLLAAGLPVPRLLATAAGRTVIHRNHAFIEVLGWIDGEAFGPNDDEAAFALGVFIAKFHGALDCIIAPRGRNMPQREDHPEALEPYWAGLGRLATTAGERHALRKIGACLQRVQRDLDNRLYATLPHAMIHGDIHPGNIRFRYHAVSAVYDFDYLSYQARARDLADAMAFFGSTRETPFLTDNIVSLTQVFRPELRLCQQIIRGYQTVLVLSDDEWTAFPLLLQSRWLQMRLRGSRKMSQAEKLSFVLDQFFEVPQWLEGAGRDFFCSLRKSTS